MKHSAFIQLVCLLAVLASSSAHADMLRTAALTGQTAPGTSSGVTFEGFGSFHKPQEPIIYQGPVLNDVGQVAFRANLTGTGVDSSNNQGIWSEGSGSLALVARTGNQAPGTPNGVNFSTDPALELFSPVLNNVGQTAFYGGLSDGNLGLWSEGSGSLALVARNGQQAPGTPSGVNFTFDILYNNLDDVVFNDAGQTAFRANLTGSGVTSENFYGIWSEGSSGLELVARLGSQAPGLPAGVNHGDLFEAGLNNAGQTVFFSMLTGSGINDDNDRSLWFGEPGSLELVARKGSPGPVGGSFGELFNTLWINDAGQIAFHSAPLDTNVADHVWSNASSSLALIAHSGDHAPGLSSGVTFDFFPGYLAINNSGQIMVPAIVAGTGVDSTNSAGVWLADSSNLTLIVRRGDHAPGTPAGVNFDRFGLNSWPTLNDAGQVAFRSTLVGSGVDSTNDRGIWATDQSGELQLLARTGDLLEVAPGDFRTIGALEFVGATGNSDGRASAFNNLGQLVFWASFTDGSEGVFVSNAVAHVPGDFNTDGTVDAADYVVWRKGLGTTYDQDDYGLWRANFGASLGPGSGSALPSAEPLSAAVPEPSTLALLVISSALRLYRQRGRQNSHGFASPPTFAAAPTR
jgi:hypothetical protein